MNPLDPLAYPTYQRNLKGTKPSKLTKWLIKLIFGKKDGEQMIKELYE